MKLFGTDGIRGRVNKHPMTPENVPGSEWRQLRF